MIIKSADSRDGDIAILEALLKHPDASAQIRKNIETELRFIRAGVKGEKDAAYEIDFYFQKTKNIAVIHDLRIEHEGRVAQIDHLLINRVLEVDVCETKNVSQGLAVDARGMFTRFFNSKPEGMPSPVEQNQRHIAVLDAFFRSPRVTLPTRLFLPIIPILNSYILISSKARLTLPKSGSFKGQESIMKMDQFYTLREKNQEGNSARIVRAISTDTLEKVARQIARRHTPTAFNWAAKFGLSPIAGLAPVQPARSVFPSTPCHEASNRLAPLQTPPNNLFPERAVGEVAPRAKKATAAPPDPQEAPAAQKPAKSKLICACCGNPVALNVARFCWFNKPRFKEQIVCQPCQPQFP